MLEDCGTELGRDQCSPDEGGPEHWPEVTSDEAARERTERGTNPYDRDQERAHDRDVDDEVDPDKHEIPQ
jgi:hypothetical protein